ncbi:MAG: hypothetical protein ACI4PQ_02290 [Butyricicoccaceae bacterium]
MHVSDIVRSLNGRDRGRYFLVIAEEENYLFLSDGRTRRVERPKKKKRRHAELITHSDVFAKLEEGKLPSNSEVRKALAACIPVDSSTDKGGI